MRNKIKKRRSPRKRKKPLPIYVIIGLILGYALGVATQYVIIGIVMGLGVGLFFQWYYNNQEKDKEDTVK